MPDQNALLDYLRATMPSDEKVAEYKSVYDIVSWHKDTCRNRHGVIRNIPKHLVNQIYEAMVYYFGNRCGWVQKNPDGTTNIEFVHMTKVSPPPKKPWNWCGETVLFSDWQARENQNREALFEFNIGDMVEFEYDGETHRGIVSGMRKRLTVIVGHTKYYMPARLVRKV